LRCNIYKDRMESAELFGKPVLYTSLQIERESIPENWHCYDLAATDRNPVKPATLENHAVWNRVGTVLSPAPLTRENMCCAPLLLEKKQGSSIPCWI